MPSIAVCICCGDEGHSYMHNYTLFTIALNVPNLSTLVG